MLRFKDENGKDYPNWEPKKLSEVFIYKKIPQKITEKTPLLSFTIEDGVIDPKDKKTNKRDFLIKDIDNKKFQLTKFDDIIYNPSNIKFGAIHRNKLGTGVVSPIYVVLENKENPVFMEYLVRRESFIKSCQKYLVGTVVKLMTLKPEDFLEMEVSIPSSKEQEKIAIFFSRLDEYIKTNESILNEVLLQRNEVINRIFKKDISFKGFENSVWQEYKIDELFKISAGGDLEKNNSSNIYSDEYPYPVYSNALMNNGLYAYANYYKISGDSITVTGRGDVGHAVARHCSYVPIVRLLSLTPKKECCVDFVAEAINRSKIYIESTGVPQLTIPQIGDVKVKLPSIEEQKTISKLINEYDELIMIYKKKIEEYNELKKGFMQSMFV